jgi:DNA-binding CsgD family transcriptional regulator
MTPYAMCFDEAGLVADEKRIETAFNRSLLEIASNRTPSQPEDPASNTLNILRQPAMLLDSEGCVIETNVAAATVFGPDIYVRERRLVIRDAEARSRLQSIVCLLRGAVEPHASPVEPIVIPRQERLPVLLRLWPFAGGAGWTSPEIRALAILTALGPRPGPPPEILAKAFSLTPSEARLACIVARGAGPDVAAKELKISRETARNQLKAVFAKTGTHRQSELVALLLQVQ